MGYIGLYGRNLEIPRAERTTKKSVHFKCDRKKDIPINNNRNRLICDKYRLVHFNCDCLFLGLNK